MSGKNATTRLPLRPARKQSHKARQEYWRLGARSLKEDPKYPSDQGGTSDSDNEDKQASQVNWSKKASTLGQSPELPAGYQDDARIVDYIAEMSSHLNILADKKATSSRLMPNGAATETLATSRQDVARNTTDLTGTRERKSGSDVKGETAKFLESTPKFIIEISDDEEPIPKKQKVEPPKPIPSVLSKTATLIQDALSRARDSPVLKQKSSTAVTSSIGTSGPQSPSTMSIKVQQVENAKNPLSSNAARKENPSSEHQVQELLKQTRSLCPSGPIVVNNNKSGIGLLQGIGTSNSKAPSRNTASAEQPLEKNHDDSDRNTAKETSLFFNSDSEDDVVNGSTSNLVLGSGLLPDNASDSRRTINCIRSMTKRLPSAATLNLERRHRAQNDAPTAYPRALEDEGAERSRMLRQIALSAGQAGIQPAPAVTQPSIRSSSQTPHQHHLQAPIAARKAVHALGRDSAGPRRLSVAFLDGEQVSRLQPHWPYSETQENKKKPDITDIRQLSEASSAEQPKASLKAHNLEGGLSMLARKARERGDTEINATPCGPGICRSTSQNDSTGARDPVLVQPLSSASRSFSSPSSGFLDAAVVSTTNSVPTSALSSYATTPLAKEHERAKLEVRDLKYTREVFDLIARLLYHSGDVTDTMRKDLEKVHAFADLILTSTGDDVLNRPARTNIQSVRRSLRERMKNLGVEDLPVQEHILERLMIGIAAHKKLETIERKLRAWEQKADELGEKRIQETTERHRKRPRKGDAPAGAKLSSNAERSSNLQIEEDTVNDLGSSAHARNRTKQAKKGKLTLQEKREIYERTEDRKIEALRQKLSTFSTHYDKEGLADQEASITRDGSIPGTNQGAEKEKSFEEALYSVSEESEEEEGAEYANTWARRITAEGSVAPLPQPKQRQLIHSAEVAAESSLRHRSGAGEEREEEGEAELVENTPRRPTIGGKGLPGRARIYGADNFPSATPPVKTAADNPQVGRTAAETVGQVVFSSDEEATDRTVFEYVVKGIFEGYNFEGEDYEDGIPVRIGGFFRIKEADRKLNKVFNEANSSGFEPSKLTLNVSWDSDGLVSRSLAYDGGDMRVACRLWIERHIVPARKFPGRGRKKDKNRSRTTYAVLWEKRITRELPPASTAAAADTTLRGDDDDGGAQTREVEVIKPGFTDVETFTTKDLANRRAKSVMSEWFGGLKAKNPKSEAAISSGEMDLRIYLNDLEELGMWKGELLFEREREFGDEVMRVWVQQVVSRGPWN